MLLQNSTPFTPVPRWAPLPQRCHPMPLAIINGVLRDEAGLPTAQLVAVVTQGQDSVSWGWCVVVRAACAGGCSFSWEEP